MSWSSWVYNFSLPLCTSKICSKCRFRCSCSFSLWCILLSFIFKPLFIDNIILSWPRWTSFSMKSWFNSTSKSCKSLSHLVFLWTSSTTFPFSTWRSISCFSLSCWRRRTCSKFFYSFFLSNFFNFIIRYLSF